MPDAVGKMKQFATYFTHGVRNGAKLRVEIYRATEARQIVDQVDALTQRGCTYFALSAAGKTTPAKNAEVVQGKIESSNVESSSAAVKLVGVLRQFEMMQRAVRIASEMGRQSVEQVAKVGI